MPKTAPHIDPHDEPISAVLHRLLDHGPKYLTVEEIADAFGNRAFGALLFIFSVPNLLPLPPGSSSVLSLPLIFLSPQVAIGMRHPWLPKFMARRKVERRKLKQGFAKIMPRLQKVESLLKPRLGIMFNPVGDRLIGLVCFLLSLVLVLPIPLGNLAPAASICALSLALTTRDGVLALVGYALTALSVGLLVVSAGAVILAVERLMHILGI